MPVLWTLTQQELHHQLHHQLQQQQQQQVMVMLLGG
jgi:hypothetical protein